MHRNYGQQFFELSVLAAMAVAFFCSFHAAAMGQEARGPVSPPSRDRPYDGIQAGLEAYEQADEVRRANLAGQAATTDFLSSGAYRFFPPLPPPWAAQPAWPGSIFYDTNPTTGFYYPRRVIIGQREVQTSENRWESRPIYSEPRIFPAPFGTEVFPATQLPEAAYELPASAPSPPSGGRREF